MMDFSSRVSDLSGYMHQGHNQALDLMVSASQLPRLLTSLEESTGVPSNDSEGMKSRDKKKRYCVSGMSKTSYLSSKIAKTLATEKNLQRESVMLQQAKFDLQMQELRCRVGIDIADEHMRLAIARRCLLSSTGSSLQHRQSQCEGSIHAIPPRTQWNAHVAEHLDQIDLDRYRYLSLTAVQHLSKLLGLACQDGPQSQAHAEIINVMDKIMAVSAYMLRMNTSVLMANMERHQGTGDASNPPDESYWKKVANSLPSILIKPEAVVKMRSYASLYKANMSSIYNERELLAKELKRLSPPAIEFTGESSLFNDTIPGNRMDCSQVVVKEEAACDLSFPDGDNVDAEEIDPIARIDKLLEKMKANLLHEVSERMTLVEFFRTQVITPVAIAALVTSAFPYVLNGPAVMAALCERFASQ